MSNSRTNYVIAAWSGVRRDGGDGLACLKKQISQLHLLKHQLNQVTVVVPCDFGEPDGYRNYLDSLSKSPLQIKVIRRPNTGLSYGSWSHAYELYRGQFDYHIFMEDDYYFVEDFFDQTLIEMLTGNGYLCGFVSERDGKRWPGNSNGIASAAALEAVRSKFGCLPYDKMTIEGKYTEESGQVGWGLAFQQCGYEISDITKGGYACLHWYWQRKEWGLIPGQPKGNKLLFVPYQVSRNSAFRLFKDRHIGQEGILLATGPTFREYDWIENNGNRILVGVNSVIKEDRYLDYYFCGHLDGRSLQYLDEIEERKGVKFGYTRVNGASNSEWFSDRHALDVGLLPYELTTSLNFQDDISIHPALNHAINFSALQFMIYAGMKKIYLVGCDATAVTSHLNPSIDELRSVENMMKAWRAFKEYVRDRIEIVCVNPVGLKGMFEERISNAQR